MNELSLYLLAIFTVWAIILKYFTLWQFTHAAAPVTPINPLRKTVTLQPAQNRYPGAIKDRAGGVTYRP